MENKATKCYVLYELDGEKMHSTKYQCKIE